MHTPVQDCTVHTRQCRPVCQSTLDYGVSRALYFHYSLATRHDFTAQPVDKLHPHGTSLSWLIRSRRPRPDRRHAGHRASLDLPPPARLGHSSRHACARDDAHFMSRSRLRNLDRKIVASPVVFHISGPRGFLQVETPPRGTHSGPGTLFRPMR